MGGARSPESAYAQVTRVYRLARLHVNFFQPVEQLLTKTRQGARTHRVYDRAQTPTNASRPPAPSRPSPAANSKRSTRWLW
jgi:hypothetical protein